MQFGEVHFFVSFMICFLKKERILRRIRRIRDVRVTRVVSFPKVEWLGDLLGVFDY